METPEHDRLRVAPPRAGAERGWLSLVLDRLVVPALVIDTATGRVVHRNPAAGQIPPDGVEVTIDNEPVVPDALFARLAIGASTPAGVTVGWRATDRETRYRVYARPLPPADGEAPLAVLTFVETADRDAAERELRDALALRDEFFSVATHELKDPLFSIQLSLQLLRYATERQQVPVSPHLARHMDVCGRQAERLSRLVDNLLDVSRIQSGRLRLDPEALDLADLTREVVSRFQEAARAAGTSLTAETGGPVLGYFDRMKLDQVLSNLLTNAHKYGAGQPVVVRAREEGDLAVLEVADRGPGVAAVDRERIFDRFERASDGHQNESLGLGLYIVKSIVEAHGGTVAVRGEPGQGATFVVTLPRNRLHQGGATGQDLGVSA